MTLDNALVTVTERAGEPRWNHPAQVSIPFAAGTVNDAETVGLSCPDGNLLPLQRRVLSRWPDGSVKWMLLDWQDDIAPRETKTYRLIQSESLPPDPTSALKIGTLPDGVEVDAGPIRAELRRARGLMHLYWRGVPVCSQEGLRLVSQDAQGEDFLGEVDKVEVLESGPLRAVIALTGQHLSGQEKPCLSFRLRFTFYANQPFVKVEHTFYHCQEEPILEIGRIGMQWGLAFRRPGAKCMSWNRHHFGGAFEGELNAHVDSDFLELRANDRPIAVLENGGPENYWYVPAAQPPGYPAFDLWDGQVGLALITKHLTENWPKAIRLSEQELRLDFYPEGAEPLRVYQGMAKTHTFWLELRGEARSPEEVKAAAWVIQRPLIGAVAPEYVAETKAAGEILPSDPELRPRLEGAVASAFMPPTVYRTTGILDFGDEEGVGYTAQGRGGGKRVFYNHEHDLPHIAFEAYLRSGVPAILETGMIRVRHMLDVDFCHYHPNPLTRGGIIMHCAEHASTGFATPCHEWLEGFLDYYHLTGDPDGLSQAKAVGDNLLRHLETGELDCKNHPPRTLGWALIALSAIAGETGEERYKTGASRIARTLVEWNRERPGFQHVMHWGWIGVQPFMVAICNMGLSAYHRLFGGEEVAETIVSVADYLMGIRNDMRPVSLEGFARAYRLTGDATYVRRGVEILARTLGESFTWRGVFPFLKAASDAGLLEEVEHTNG